MSDLAGRARTGLESVIVSGRFGTAAGPAGAILSLRQPVSAIATVMARRGATSKLGDLAKDALGIVLPDARKASRSGRTMAVWSGPGHWLVLSDDESGSAFETRLRAAFVGYASVSDQSDSRLILRLSGPRARDVLAKGMPIDLAPESFTMGDAASTLMGHIGVQIWQVDDAPAYELAVARSYALDLWRFVTLAGAEFGLEIEA